MYEDDRGFFKETYSTRKYRELGLADEFVQDSVSFSTRNVIRGLHYDRAMSKLVQVLRGKIWDVIVDLRPSSATYLRWQGFYLERARSPATLRSAPVSRMASSRCPTTCIFSYKHGALYDPATEGAIRWNDPTLAIAWPLVGEPRISAKDRAAPLFADTDFPQRAH